ncbi:Arc family DNA-binding protein [Ochrobactrum sp. AP1BH01-1]|jgi:hypothetical protein|uniref:Arc family DNA-binding protein n=1 Tax=Ochrobactrum sp. AP1BH01-1 TaxID=2823874 RepID=UPI001B386743|nr:Arc family DNA-binding protein [Ochrobactrum sp. AP1BH01-1]MBQ0707867.1 Arc family DNA-binding protein [Ochrobactrum sp. AP1BH01-1]
MTKEPLQPQDKYVLRLPDGMRDRIKLAAEKNNRSMNAEIVATLEEAYPPPLAAPYYFPGSDIGMLVLHWNSRSWAFIDWENWMHLKFGEVDASSLPNASDQHNYFVTAVLDKSGKLWNLIVNNLLINGNRFDDAGFQLLTKEERSEYSRLMSAATATAIDDKRLNDLRKKMIKAYRLPDDSIPKLRDVLIGIAPAPVVDKLIKERIVENSL